MNGYPAPEVDFDRLENLTELARGGQGKVHDAPRIRINQSWPVVFKEYFPEVLARLDTSVLADMVGHIGRMDPNTARWLCDQAAWPAAVVRRQGQLCGFLMRRLPDEFHVDLALGQRHGRRPGGWEYLLNPEDYLARLGIPITDQLRLILLRELAATLSRLHQLSIAVGDLSPKNLLFSLTPRPACFFIDCDAMRLAGRSALPQVETPDWEVPPGEELATPASDAYKLGLLAVRLFAGDQSSRDPDVLRPLSAELSDLARRSMHLNPAVRPLPQEWPAALDRAIPHAATALPGQRAAAGGWQMAISQLAPPPNAPPPYPPAPPNAAPPQPVPVPGPAWGTAPVTAPPPRRRWVLRTAVAGVVLGAIVLIANNLNGHGAASGGPLTQPPQPVPATGYTTTTTTPTYTSPTPATYRVGVVDYSPVSGDDRAPDVATMFDTYFSNINSHNYDAAVQVYDPSGVVNPGNPRSRQSFATAMSSTADSDVQLESLGSGDGGAVAVTARVAFRSTQAAGMGPKGSENETCTRWQVTYSLSEPGTHQYRIVRGSGTHQSC